MKAIILLLFTSLIPLFCNASEEANAEYTITSLYSGAIGKNSITMSLSSSGRTVSGGYIYNRFKINILLNGEYTDGSVVLNEKVGGIKAFITLKPELDGYKGQWCGKTCLPVTLSTHDSFKNGALGGVKISGSDNNGYKLKLEYKDNSEYLILQDSIDTPTIHFVDVNGDGFYDIIARTDHRANNGSQDVYISTNKGFVKNKELSEINGTLNYKPFSKYMVFSSKEDCCERYSKIIYTFSGGRLVKLDDISFDYLKDKGRSESGTDVPKNEFESY